MTCGQCGSPNPVDAAWCGRCGSRLGQPNQLQNLSDAPIRKASSSEAGPTASLGTSATATHERIIWNQVRRSRKHLLAVLSVVLSVAIVTLAITSWRLNWPITVASSAAHLASHSNAMIAGHVDPPFGSPNRYRIFSNARTYAVNSSGAFEAPMSQPVTLLVAQAPDEHHALLAVAVDGGPRRQSTVNITAKSTAQALVFLSPYLATGIGTRAAAILRRLPTVSGLSQLTSDIKSLGGLTAQPNTSRLAQDLRSTAAAAARDLTSLSRQSRRSESNGQLLSYLGDQSATTPVLANSDPASGAPCAQDYPVSGAFSGISDNTLTSVLADQNQSQCDISVTDNGPASQSVLGVIPPIIPAWVDVVYSLPASAFTSTSAVQAAANDPSQRCSTFGESSPETGTSVVLPPLSYVDWLTDPVATALSSAAGFAFSALGGSVSYNVVVPASTPALYISRAFSGGGQWTGSGSLNPFELNNNCLTSALPDGNTFYQEGESLNFVFILLDAISPIVDMGQTVKDNAPCWIRTVQAAFGPAAQAIGSSNTNNSGVAAALESFIGSEYQKVTSDLLGCESSQAVSLTLEGILGEATSALLDKAFAAADEAGALLTLGNLEEYSHAVESAFVPIDSPFSASSGAAPGGSTPSSGTPSSWLGTWTGAITQPGSPGPSPWHLTMNIDSLAGGQAGTYQAPDLMCSGTLSFVSISGNSLELNETVTVQPPFGTAWYCVGGPITLTSTGQDTATYSWSGGAASGLITKASSSSSSSSPASTPGSGGSSAILGTWAVAPITDLLPPPNGSAGLTPLQGFHLDIASVAASGVVQGSFSFFGDGLLSPTANGTMDGELNGSSIDLRGSAAGISFTFTGSDSMQGDLTIHGNTTPVSFLATSGQSQPNQGCCGINNPPS